jgi:hypothetical protein
MAATGQDPRTRYRIEFTQRRCSVRSWYPITNRWNKIAIAHRARGGPAGPFHAGRAGQGNN